MHVGHLWCKLVAYKVDQVCASAWVRCWSRWAAVWTVDVVSWTTSIWFTAWTRKPQASCCWPSECNSCFLWGCQVVIQRKVLPLVGVPFKEWYSLWGEGGDLSKNACSSAFGRSGGVPLKEWQLAFKQWRLCAWVEGGRWKDQWTVHGMPENEHREDVLLGVTLEPVKIIGRPELIGFR